MVCWFRRLIAKVDLWMCGYCSKHFHKKDTFLGAPGYMSYRCPLCFTEKQEKAYRKDISREAAFDKMAAKAIAVLKETK